MMNHAQATRGTEQPVVKTKKGRKVLFFSFAIFCLSALCWSWLKLTDPSVFPIHSIKVQGNFNYLDKQDVRQAIMPFVNHGFIALDVIGLKMRLQEVPWVYSASITRVWPDIVEVHIQEQQPIARWNNSELMNIQGDIFSQNKAVVHESLPLLEGPIGQQKIVLQSYQQMNTLLEPLELKVSKLTLTPRHAWFATLSNGTTLIIGREDTFIRLQRFVKAYHQIFDGKGKTAEYVDLRYGHGLSVRW